MIGDFGEIFGEPIPAYFTMLVVGFALATLVGTRLAMREGIDKDTFIDLGLFSLIWGIVGARILHVLADGFFWDYVHLCTDPSEVAWRITRAQCDAWEQTWDAVAGVCRPKERDCFAWAKFWNGGLTYYGGLIAGTAFGAWFLRKEGVPPWKGADIVGCVIPLGLFWGRMGCFLGGCCFGSPTSPALAVRFPAFSPASETQWREGLLPSPGHESLPVHPAQLYEAGGSLLLFALATFFLLPRKRFDGQVILAVVALYGALRFGLEMLRADDRGGMLGLSTSQWLSIVAIAVAAAVWARLAKRAVRVTSS